MLRAAGLVTLNTAAKVHHTGGKGGSGAQAGSGSYAKPGVAGQTGPVGEVDSTYLAVPGGLGSNCGPAAGCGAGLSCQAVSGTNLCTLAVCVADADCKLVGVPPGKCLAPVAMGATSAKLCFPPCSATMSCSRPDFTCDLTQSACVPDCRKQTNGFCPSFTTCNAKTGLCAIVPCSGTCAAGNICWSNGCNKQVCTPDCTAPTGTACKLDIDCPSGVCLDGTCAACLKGATCSSLTKTCSQVGAPVCGP